MSMKRKLPPVPSPSGTPGEFSHTTVLIIDDDPTYRFLLRGLCTKLGVGIIKEAEDGERGIESAHSLNPDMILLDIMMPGINGIEVCRALRAHPETANTAILIQTGATSEKERMEAFAAGATDVVTKPINLTEFTARVRTHLRNAIFTRDLADYRARLATHIEIAHGFMEGVTQDITTAQECARRNGFEIQAAQRTAEEIGGDIWYLDEIAPGKLLLLLIDASAHGLAGAINALRVDTLLRELRLHHADPKDLLLALDRAMAQSPCGRLFAAVTAAILDSNENALWYAASGNPYPIIYHHNDAQSLASGGLPLGSGFVTLELNKISMEYDDVLVLHTDGWPTQNDVNPVLLIKHVLNTGALNPDALIGSDPINDDITLLTIRRVRPCTSPSSATMTT
ncbi:MAG: fused response regulator/phosphatase [Alphaproteobacteria bacterium]